MRDSIIELDAAAVAVDDAGKPAAKRVVLSFGNDPRFVAGRRSWVKYRELGITQASSGAMRGQVIVAGHGENQPTGWHLHRCDMQFLYVLSGAIHIAFSPGHVYRLGAGDSIMIPGGTMHMEMGEAEGVEVIEVSCPAEMGTEPCSPPWAEEKIDWLAMVAAARGPQ